MRKIVVNNLEFSYIVGYTKVKILGPGPMILLADCHEVKGLTASAYEVGQWKKTEDGRITPKDIADWIKRHDVSKQIARTQ